MKRIRVLIVDDSLVVRRLVRDALSTDPELEICGVAANGRIAVSMIEQISPDILTLDIEMPEMDGLEVLRQLGTKGMTIPVIMFSTLTQRGAIATLEALALGARDYVTKPANVGSVTTAIETIRMELVPKIKALCGGAPIVKRAEALVPKLSFARPEAARKVVGPIEVVAIGTSTGGPNALANVLPALPGDFPVPVLVVQHMPPTFTRFLAERLNRECQLRVAEAAEDQVLAAGQVLVAPGDFHMVVEQRGTRVHLRTVHTPPENSCRPAVDVLFRSVARVYGGRALAVVMTGMGQDGLRGAEQLHEAGANILAQDEASSVVWGMPGFVAQAGLAAKVLPLPQIAGEIVRRVNESHRKVRFESAKYVH
ncbi:MAG: protein-glutamate methylesterase/protein-glutamine glutaminase [Terriglobales bacterium]